MSTPSSDERLAEVLRLFLLPNYSVASPTYLDLLLTHISDKTNGCKIQIQRRSFATRLTFVSFFFFFFLLSEANVGTAATRTNLDRAGVNAADCLPATDGQNLFIRHADELNRFWLESFAQRDALYPLSHERWRFEALVDGVSSIVLVIS